MKSRSGVQPVKFGLAIQHTPVEAVCQGIIRGEV